LHVPTYTKTLYEIADGWKEFLNIVEKIPSYSVTVENDGNGTATANPDTAAAETEITLTATANEGYEFDHWEVISGDITITDNKFIMPNEDVRVKAYFKETNDGIVGATSGCPLQAYPNPAKDILHIVSAGANNYSPVQIYNIAGQSVMIAPLNPPKGGKLPSFGGVGGGITIDISHLANGLYFLKIGKKTVKIVKE